MFVISNEISPGATSPVELHEGWLRVPLGQGDHGDFHYRWLRASCDEDRHPQTGERTVCSSELPDGVRPRGAAVRDGRLWVEWAEDGRVSRYDLGWLREHAYALNRAAVPPPPSDLGAVQIEGAGVEAAVEAALARLAERGLAVVRRPPSDVAPEDETEAIIRAFEARGLGVIGTHFGRIEDLRTDNTTNVNTDQLGYTDAPVQLHTDQPFLQKPPRYQLLQGVRAAEQGGENFLVDARAAYRYLASLDARAAELLATTPVRFHRRQKHFESIVDGPLISRDDDAGFLIRLSYFTLAPHRLPFDRMEEFYKAHDRFVRLVRAPEHQYRFALRPGDWVLYDNHRMLHARTGFRGARWVRGIYFDAR